ncbi:unnamed protein product [Callosobruchus maculatus]|uniref:Dynein heavy chain tail domain-containing protein n=1 Tax=Callosobruchus maculatus TaxID=64391 RepID=A0A653CCG3_CALMS|nr:unnamed protein product [Callosobruchus maculatus]
MCSSASTTWSRLKGDARLALLPDCASKRDDRARDQAYALKDKLKSYTELRKHREDFRNRLVCLITKKEGSERGGQRDMIPNAEEKQMLRYYYYVKYGVDTVHVAPLDEEVLTRVLALVPRRLMKWEKTLAETVQDVKDDFMMAVKKAIIDFVLQDPSFTKPFGGIENAFNKELKEIGTSFRASFASAKMKIYSNLHVINPCLAALLDIWHSSYRDLRLINTNDLKQHEGAFDLQEFKNAANKHIEKCKDNYMDQYYNHVTHIFLQGNKRGKLPESGRSKQVVSFYNAVAAIMTHHLQMLCMNSLYDYVEYITDVKYSNKGFQIRLQQSANILAFEPTFKNFRDILIGLTDLIVEAVTDIPRLETKLYLDWGNEAVLKPLIPAELIDVCKNRIKDVLDEQRIGPELRVHDFDEFLPLINGQGDEFVNDFVSSDHNFDDYVEQILKYKALHERIPFATEHVVRMEMYDMNRLELIKALEHLAEYLKDALIHHCIKHYQQMCTTIGEDYQVLSERVLAVPQDTAGLMALKKFVNEVETKTLPSMEDRLRSVMTYILFLADHTIFTPVEMKVPAYAKSHGRTSSVGEDQDRGIPIIIDCENKKVSG